MRAWRFWLTYIEYLDVIIPTDPIRKKNKSQEKRSQERDKLSKAWYQFLHYMEYCDVELPTAISHRVERSKRYIAHRRQYYLDHKEEHLERAKQFHTLHPEKRRVYTNKSRKKSRKENPMMIMTKTSLSSHRKKGCEVADGFLEVIRAHIKTITTCAYCGLPFNWTVEEGVYNPFYPTLDRVYNSTKMTHIWGGPDDLDEGAVAVVHHRCNSMKSNMSLSQLASICEGISKVLK